MLKVIVDGEQCVSRVFARFRLRLSSGDVVLAPQRITLQ